MSNSVWICRTEVNVIAVALLICLLNNPQNPLLVHVFLYYQSHTSDQIHFSQMDLWSRDIEHSDELLLIAINDHLLLWKTVSSYLATSCLITRYKTYGVQLRAPVLMIWVEMSVICKIALPCTIPIQPSMKLETILHHLPDELQYVYVWFVFPAWISCV